MFLGICVNKHTIKKMINKSANECRHFVQNFASYTVHIKCRSASGNPTHKKVPQLIYNQKPSLRHQRILKGFQNYSPKQKPRMPMRFPLEIPSLNWSLGSYFTGNRCNQSKLYRAQASSLGNCKQKEDARYLSLIVRNFFFRFVQENLGI